MKTKCVSFFKNPDCIKLIKRGVLRKPADYLVNIPCNDAYLSKIHMQKNNCLPIYNFNKIIIDLVSRYRKFLIP